MSIFSGGSGVVIAAVAGTAVVGGAAWYQFGRTPDVPAPVSAAVTPQVTQPQPAPEAPVEEATAPVEEEQPAEAEVAATPEPEPEAAPEVAEIPAPTFDEVRRETDGMTVIAGQGAPGAVVRILLDGAEISDTRIDGAGKFAALVMIAPDGKGHVLSLRQSADGGTQDSVDEIILAPLAPPVVVAEADVAEPEAPATDEAPEDAEAPQPATPEEDPIETAEEDTPAAPVQDVAAAEPVTEEETPPAVEVAEAPTVEEDTPPATPAEDVVEAEPEIDQNVAEAPQAEAEETTVAETEAPAETQVETAEVADPEPEETAQTTEETPAETAEEPQAVAEAEPVVEAAEAPTVQAEAPIVQQAPETQDVAVLRNTESGVELLNTTPPEVMSNVELDTISYSDEGEVQLAGRAQTETKAVRVYLNNTAIVSLPVDDRGRWRGDLPDVDEGIYTLRVDEVAADGSVTSRVETPFKREDPEVLAEAAAEQDGPLKKITVQKGATLWAIARERYGDGLLYVRVFDANKADIRNPDLIYPGQIFELPEQ